MKPLFKTSALARGMVLLTPLVLVAASCAGGDAPSTPPADAVSLGPTSTTLTEDAPPVVIGGAPGSDGFLPVRLNPAGWENIALRVDNDDPADPFYELHSDGHDNFWFGVELHTVKGAGWTGELGLFATDCLGAGICVRFDPDGGAGPIGPLLAAPTGEIDVEKLDSRAAELVFRHLIFTRDDGVDYRIDTVILQRG